MWGERRGLTGSGTDVFLRLSTFILLCLGVQILTNGLAALPWLARG
jgi:small neutral amino acid transporter SnatA (MarC family)